MPINLKLLRFTQQMTEMHSQKYCPVTVHSILMYITCSCILRFNFGYDTLRIHHRDLQLKKAYKRLTNFKQKKTTINQCENM